jgi:hypothetical protein
MPVERGYGVRPGESRRRVRAELFDDVREIAGRFDDFEDGLLGREFVPLPKPKSVGFSEASELVVGQLRLESNRDLASRELGSAVRVQQHRLDGCGIAKCLTRLLPHFAGVVRLAVEAEQGQVGPAFQSFEVTQLLQTRRRRFTLLLSQLYNVLRAAGSLFRSHFESRLDPRSAVGRVRGYNGSTSGGSGGVRRPTERLDRRSPTSRLDR